jgi:hypothetical protein
LSYIEDPRNAAKIGLSVIFNQPHNLLIRITIITNKAKKQEYKGEINIKNGGMRFIAIDPTFEIDRRANQTKRKQFIAFLTIPFDFEM